jgi:hypothetical protein
MKARFLLGLLCLLSVIFISCGSGEVKPPTCNVYVENGKINVVIDLPAEEMEYHDTHNLTPSGVSGTPSKVTIESGGSSMKYSKTGNSYNIAYTVTYENGEIANYHISIKGNVYGDVEHTCTK